MNRAQTFVVQTAGVRLSPFKPATELGPSALEGDLVRMSLACGKHEAFCPAELAQRTLRSGTHHTFLTSCKCPVAYIIRTEADGAYMKSGVSPA
jgi:hypothetical protein